MSEYERIYDGKRYAKANTVKTKVRATKITNSLRKQGYNARMESCSRGYHIYYRGDNWK